MKNKNGFTLAEVMVSVAVSAILICALLSAVLSLSALPARQKELTAFRFVCRDIALYGDEYGREWDKHYFAGVVNTAQPHGCVYYDAAFLPLSSSDSAKYLLNYEYNDRGALVVTVEEISSGRAVIEALDYGAGRYQ